MLGDREMGDFFLRSFNVPSASRANIPAKIHVWVDKLELELKTSGIKSLMDEFKNE